MLHLLATWCRWQIPAVISGLEHLFYSITFSRTCQLLKTTEHRTKHLPEMPIRSRAGRPYPLVCSRVGTFQQSATSTHEETGRPVVRRGFDPLSAIPYPHRLTCDGTRT